MSKPTHKRTVSTDALETLGKIHERVEKRDAIHLAVEPVEAGELLYPGSHITVKNGIATQTGPGRGIGIVDPFLLTPVSKGQRFWFVMYPGAVHSLRHVWTHPAFPDEPEAAEEVQETKKTARRTLKTSRSYINQHAEALGFTYDSFMERVDSWISTGDRYIGGHEAEGYVIPDEFWSHWELVTGRTVPERRRGNFISCSC